MASARELTDDHWRVVHEIAIRGRLEATAGADVVEPLLACGMVQQRRTFLLLSAEGRDAHARWARVVDDAVLAATQRAYEAFLPLNGDLIRVCADWQVRPGGAANDHRDRAYDWQVIDRLTAIDERAGVIARRLGRAVDRFAGYRPRLTHALRRVNEGDLDWFTSPRIDSYHTVWMHLHEDLLLALGRSRADEPDPA